MEDKINLDLIKDNIITDRIYRKKHSIKTNIKEIINREDNKKVFQIKINLKATIIFKDNVDKNIQILEEMMVDKVIKKIINQDLKTKKDGQIINQKIKEDIKIIVEINILKTEKIKMISNTEKLPSNKDFLLKIEINGIQIREINHMALEFNNLIKKINKIMTKEDNHHINKINLIIKEIFRKINKEILFLMIKIKIIIEIIIKSKEIININNLMIKEEVNNLMIKEEILIIIELKGNLKITEIKILIRDNTTIKIISIDKDFHKMNTINNI